MPLLGATKFSWPLLSIKPALATREPFLSLAQTRMVSLVFMVELNMVPAGSSRRICFVEPVIVKVDVVAADAIGIKQIVMSSIVRAV